MLTISYSRIKFKKVLDKLACANYNEPMLAEANEVLILWTKTAEDQKYVKGGEKNDACKCGRRERIHHSEYRY